MPEAAPRRIAYFTMEIALETRIPTYSGGLGVLAGDTIRSAADMGVPLVAMTLLYRQGYFVQKLDPTGGQTEAPAVWRVEDVLKLLEPRITVEIQGRQVAVRVWQFTAKGQGGATVPVYLLDTELPENDEADRKLTNDLYGGDNEHRLRQEMLLGAGGFLMLRALGHRSIEVFHMNEGHAALLAIPLWQECVAAGVDPLPAIKRQCVFTTHTPVPAGHDRFSPELVAAILPAAGREILAKLVPAGELNMSVLAIAITRYVNGVAMRHGEVSRAMFPDANVRSITNGVHVPTWASPPFRALFDRWVPEWRADPVMLRNAMAIPADALWDAHQAAKQAMVDAVKARSGIAFDRDALTLVYARRATAYKRPMLLFDDLERLISMTRYVGPLQIAFAGKSHPRDNEGKALIRRVYEIAQQLKGKVPVAYLENYDMELAGVLAAGCDVWVNTPRPPMEASGTSGMKAAVNGVPSLSVLDGWWVEGHLEGATGWAVGEFVAEPENPANDRKIAHALYEKLSKAVLPCYYKDRDRYIEIMRRTIAFNAAFFNTNRMLAQYLLHAYRLG